MAGDKSVIEKMDVRKVEVAELIDGQWVSVYSQLTEKPVIELVCYINGITIERSEPPAESNRAPAKPEKAVPEVEKAG